ncbi:hypothetical protein D3C79_967610 [compost metagenome]
MFGTVFGVIVIPGLYYIFGKIAEKHKLIRIEDEQPLTEELENKLVEGHMAEIEEVLN